MSPCHHFKGNCDADHLDDNSRIVNHRGCVGCFDDSRDISDCNADGSLIHGYVQQDDEPFSCPLAASVVGRLDMYRTKVLMCRMMVLMARLTRVRR